jgi:hypothetical protein
LQRNYFIPDLSKSVQEEWTGENIQVFDFQLKPDYMKLTLAK